MDNQKIRELYQKFISSGSEIAKEKCLSGSHIDSENCAWYHGNWMLFRYLGVVSNPFWHEKFYYKALELAKAKNEDKALLVVGTADFSMPLLCSEFGIRNIDICDLCKTPLYICKKVSDSLGYDWQIYPQAIHDIPSKYDIIINDAFLSRFTDNKTDILRDISKSLKPQGYYITTLKHGSKRNSDISDQVKKEFIDRVNKRYHEEISNFQELSKFNINDISKTYVKKMSSCPVKDVDEVRELFKKANLNILQIEEGKVPGEFEQPCNYFRIISQKTENN